MNSVFSTEILTLLAPLGVLTIMAAVILLVIAFWRHHGLIVALTCFSVILSAAALIQVMPLWKTFLLGRTDIPMLIFDRQAIFFSLIWLGSALVIAFLSYSYWSSRSVFREEFYLLLLVATLGAIVLTSSAHFATFFLGLEVMTVSLYALIAYVSDEKQGIEASIKYLILAATADAFLLFGIAMIYAGTGSLELVKTAALLASAQGSTLVGFALLLVGVCFKLALVPLHMWIGDVYQGAPAPVGGFLATVSKGAILAFLVRYFMNVPSQGGSPGPLFVGLMSLGLVSMLGGSVLALFQSNFKRLLAYSSIAHMGYVSLALVAVPLGHQGINAAEFYVLAYVVTSLLAFGVMIVVSSDKDRDEDAVSGYEGFAWQNVRNRPWLAAFLTVAMLSLAGVPLTGGFFGKFLLVKAGIAGALWPGVMTLVLASAISVLFYLRVIWVLFKPEKKPMPNGIDGFGRWKELILLGVGALFVLALGTFPSWFVAF